MHITFACFQYVHCQYTCAGEVYVCLRVGYELCIGSVGKRKLWRRQIDETIDLLLQRIQKNERKSMTITLFFRVWVFQVIFFVYSSAVVVFVAVCMLRTFATLIHPFDCSRIYVCKFSVSFCLFRFYPHMHTLSLSRALTHTELPLWHLLATCSQTYERKRKKRRNETLYRVYQCVQLAKHRALSFVGSVWRLCCTVALSFAVDWYWYPIHIFYKWNICVKRARWTLS